MDRAKLIKALGATAQVMGQQVTDDALLMMVDDLEGYDEKHVAAALKSARRQRARFSIALVLEYLVANDGRLSADRAWAEFPKDENETAIVSDEMTAAWGVAIEMYDNGDKVGAQIAFKREYNMLIERNREAGKKVNWFPSIGFDVDSRDEPLLKGFADGRIGFEQAERLVSHRALPQLARLSGNQKLIEHENKPPARLPSAEIQADLVKFDAGKILLKKMRENLLNG